eukprot:CAMPEP_0113406722 /NCGR_PEP_ID=MMETSP0013_2-20120614/19669_1 /TAXON_ID=2843 ORGANISM="Skeletonema costatum, Strain 1716" /NCGR_SAMPLE_ID=MMETSP0013_2 /ASSEMBLY_ACC=CAM_ASM_000158 /LENGTH=218 /DNA_ID=CAMNT_0000292599 /DNA_START=87 /DNA_END=743 /DNA_ORIENTATION=+ /assembly_acc=CAM_ASM_000158
MTKSILVMLASAQVVSGFSLTTTQLRTPTQIHSTITSTTSEEVVVKTHVPVTRISVCAGELCQCQGEEYEYTGGASDAAVKELRQLDLKFPIDEVGCLGACGMGTMIAIDYENGDSIMTDGLESTYTELGISASTQSLSSADDGSEQSNDIVEATSSAVVSDATTTPIATKKKPSAKELVDVRERMRQESADVEVENPWLKMGGYLAKKATSKLFGSD